MASSSGETPGIQESLSAGDTSTGTDDPQQQTPRLSAMVMEETMNLFESEEDGGKGTGTTKDKPTSTTRGSGSKSKKSSSSSGRSRSNSGDQNAAVVSVERKEELLLEARVNRMQWIHQVPLPYRKAESPDDPWVQEKGLASFLKTCHAAALMPNMTKVLSHLYGMSPDNKRATPEEVALRIENLLGSLGEEDDPSHSFVRPGEQVLESEIAKAGPTGNEVLMGYQEFWYKLQTPECASLVQSMRTAIRNLDSVDEPRNLEEIAQRFQTYLTGAFESIKAHAAWRKSGTNDRTKHSLESFIYGQCYALVQSKLWSEEALKKEEAWTQRLGALQFVTPKHLDIACLEDLDVLASGDLDQALAVPMEALLSVDLYFSPYEKLQRILAMYHGVNAALSKALNKGETTKGGKAKMPSADDVLPTIILTVLRAKPARIHTNLQMVELFCPQEYLRGEAGYACTNLFGAVQFLLDLELKVDAEGEAPKSLSISFSEFRKGLEESRIKFQNRLEKGIIQRKKIPTDIDLQYCDIPASQIRSARNRGETVDLNWALAWQKEKMEADAAAAAAAAAAATATQTTAGGQSTAEDVLPPGFSRTYTFLTARPEDIRMSDLPQLLAEYRMLVHTSETLLGERASRLAAERKKKVNSVQEELLANVRKVDPSLLPENQSFSS